MHDHHRMIHHSSNLLRNNYIGLIEPIVLHKRCSVVRLLLSEDVSRCKCLKDAANGDAIHSGMTDCLVDDFGYHVEDYANLVGHVDLACLVEVVHVRGNGQSRNQ